MCSNQLSYRRPKPAGRTRTCGPIDLNEVWRRYDTGPFYQKVSEQQTARATGTRPDVTGRSSAGLRHPIRTICFRMGQQAPGQLVRPYQSRRPASRQHFGSRTRDRTMVWSEGRPGYGTRPETIFLSLLHTFRATSGGRVSRGRSHNRGVEPILLLPKKQLSTSEVSPAYGT